MPPSDAPDLPSDARPAACALGVVLRQVAVSIAVACAVPAALFYVTLVTFSITTAVLAALAWAYGAVAWRWATDRPMSGLLALTVTILTVRTVFTLATGNTFVYFLQPMVSDSLVAVLFLVSLATARPLVARLAADFYPMSPALADQPCVRRLFWRLTLMWGGVCLAKGALGYWLLTSLSTADFVLVKNGVMIAVTALAVAVTIRAALCVLQQAERAVPV
ncbi:VC0807 family protein [Nocardioides sp. C4-1]|uniref:VC0807 family protein n=1 Tax=Nocardioides sp. C4-1 TaxID=3151851 RepID=UPI003264186A